MRWCDTFHFTKPLPPMNRRFILALCLCLVAATGAHADAWRLDLSRLISSARGQVGVTLSYDPEFRVIAYPGGDVPQETGVCTDVLIRTFRDQKIDLQKEVHEDMTAHFAVYPQQWGLHKPDTNIDHRRAPNLMTFFKRRGYQLPISQAAADYRAGDIVAWNLSGAITHIGIVSDRATSSGTPLILHNIGAGAQEEDILFKYKIIGHYRLPVP